jgi:hypothetical protein
VYMKCVELINDLGLLCSLYVCLLSLERGCHLQFFGGEIKSSVCTLLTLSMIKKTSLQSNAYFSTFV